MPIYEYQCNKCGKTFEIYQRITANEDIKCPACGAEKPTRKISAFSSGSSNQSSYCSSGGGNGRSSGFG